MATEKQLQANKLNAQKSTGPKTPEGKARSAQNALKHGFTARKFIVPDELRNEFEQFEAALRSELKPAGALEEILFRQLLHAAWMLERISTLEFELLASETNPFLDTTRAQTLERLHRYRSFHQRTFFRCLKELRHQQTLRYQRQAFFKEEAAGISILVPVLEMARAENAKRTRSSSAYASFLRHFLQTKQTSQGTDTISTTATEVEEAQTNLLPNFIREAT